MTTGQAAPCVRAVGGSRYDRSHRSEAPAFPVRVPISAGAAGVAISGSAEIADADRNGSSARRSPPGDLLALRYKPKKGNVACQKADRGVRSTYCSRNTASDVVDGVAARPYVYI